jgi:rRNA-processing protein FCF1
MTRDSTEPLVSRYASRGVLVDTNVLLLYFVGRFRRERIRSFKRTSQFTERDFDRLARLLSPFARIVTTPNVLSEVSNLSGQLGDPEKTRYFRQFAREIAVLDERYVESTAASQDDCFSRLGLTDSAILRLAKDRFLVLTADAGLYDAAARARIDAINFAHFLESAAEVDRRR